MTNYILSYDLEGASDSLRECFKHELMKEGWTIWERQTADNSVRQLPNTTMLIKNKDNVYVVASIDAAVQNASLRSKGAELSKWIISEYKKVHFESDEPLSKKEGRAGDFLRRVIEDDLLP